MIVTSVFPSALILANITPVFKKASKNSKENYSPASILPDVLKIYERLLFRRINDYFKGLFFKYQCGFRQRFSAQYCLIAMLEKRKKSVKKGERFEALLTDLSKAFDCLPHDLITAKLNACGFCFSSARLIHSYLFDRKQRSSVYSSWEEILFGVPQSSILEPILFYVFICDLFSIVSNIDFASYADDNTPLTKILKK